MLGNRRSGKSSTWNALFGRAVRTGSDLRPLTVSAGVQLPVFLVSGSPEERRLYIGEIIGKAETRIVLCSLQYTEEARRTVGYFVENGYSLYVQWLNPGFNDDGPVQDTLGFVPFLLHQGALLSIRDGKRDLISRVREIREFLAGWATNRRIGGSRG